jgi:predicted flap endonuclease-1-like 5' DNA nuclease
MPVVTEKNLWPRVTQETNMKKGPLVKVQIGKGQYVKMYEADAIAQGKLPSKAKPAPANKMRDPAATQNKSVPQEPEAESAPPEPADDFTTIPGIGKGTARALVANGITTFEQLRLAGTLKYLTPKTRQAIEDWRGRA